MRQRLSDVTDDLVMGGLGDLILESIDYMLEHSNLTFMQKLSVIEGAIAFGSWGNSSKSQEELREIRNGLIKEYDYD
jgi:hypothetical protein